MLRDARGELYTGKCVARTFSCSFVVELCALRHFLRDALDLDAAALPRGSVLHVCTDSQSAVESLSAGPFVQRSRLEQDVWDGLTAVSRRFDL